MAQKIEYRERIDHKILFILASLIAFGLVMIYSIASSQDNMSLFLKQVICLCGGFAGMVCIYHFNFSFLGNRILTIMIYLASIATILVLLSPLAVTVNGATRWINLGFFNFQVAEFVKIALILAIACWTEYTRFRKGPLEEGLFIGGAWILGGVPAFMLLIISNDLSSAMVVLGITFVMSFVASRGKTGWIMHILAVIAVIAVAVFAVCYTLKNMPKEADFLAKDSDVSFRLGRIAAWIDPERYSSTIGFQPIHCLYAIANGGWFGKGLGQSWQKSILPESENDVIFAIIIEELGIIGGLILIFLFIVLVTMICKVAFGTKNLHSKMICIGIAAHIMLQVIIHCGVCTNLLPNTGLGLPFISAGMTAGFMLIAEMTLVLSVAYVYIFNKYDLNQMMIKDKVRYKNQQWFVGKGYKKKLKRIKARKRAKKLAAKNAKDTGNSSSKLLSKKKWFSKRKAAPAADIKTESKPLAPESSVSVSKTPETNTRRTSRSRFSEENIGRPVYPGFSGTGYRSSASRYSGSGGRSSASRFSDAGSGRNTASRFSDTGSGRSTASRFSGMGSGSSASRYSSTGSRGNTASRFSGMGSGSSASRYSSAGSRGNTASRFSDTVSGRNTSSRFSGTGSVRSSYSSSRFSGEDNMRVYSERTQSSRNKNGRRSGAGMYQTYVEDRQRNSVSEASRRARSKNRSIYSPGYFDGNKDIPVYGSRNKNSGGKKRPDRRK